MELGENAPLLRSSEGWIQEVFPGLVLGEFTGWPGENFDDAWAQPISLEEFLDRVDASVILEDPKGEVKRAIVIRNGGDPDAEKKQAPPTRESVQQLPSTDRNKIIVMIREKQSELSSLIEKLAAAPECKMHVVNIDGTCHNCGQIIIR